MSSVLFVLLKSPAQKTQHSAFIEVKLIRLCDLKRTQENLKPLFLHCVCKKRTVC